MSVRQGVGLFVHLFVCVMYIPVHDYLVGVYVSSYGDLTSRGVAIGMTSGLMFYFFVFVNFLVFFFSDFKWKILVVFLLMALIFCYFFPRYPARAMVYPLSEGGLMALAILARRWLETLALRIRS